MSHRLDFELKGGYLHASVTGDNTPQDVEGYLSEVRAACVQHGCLNVLIEENLQGPSLETLLIYDIVVRGSRRVHPVIRRIAYVDVNQEHDMQAMQFAETVAVNRALNVKFFSSVPDAERWLSAQERNDSAAATDGEIPFSS